ncbi:MAG: YgiQ family radical SAM protein, partial [Synergistaceae bacterium]|jgi:uncharacterized radical SAM protein YgiQ|nr:YgiQ family radical SAM protein [Synergistaceae bacterium]
MISQPDWRSRDDFEVMGRPGLAVLVAAGNLDSMLSNYSTRTRRRREDSYSPGGETGRRPDRATIVYCNRVRELWGDVPLVIGGIEASLRRIAHYDYWSDSVRRSILTDSRADILVYGMAEVQLEAIAALLASGVHVRGIRDVPGTCWRTHDRGDAPDAAELPSFESVSADRRAFADAFRIFYMEQNFATGRRLMQDQGPWMVVHNPPPPPMSSEALDRVYSLPYARDPHPSYGGSEIPALAEVRFSITSHRGCFGECAFCAISSHQGRVIQRRSARSIIDEAILLTGMPGFKGYIHDIGGPTANFRTPSCRRSVRDGPCRGRSCLFPKPCRELVASHGEYLEILRRVRDLPGVKRAFVRSGLRYDYIMADPEGAGFLEELCRHHISGQLKIAPEHSSGSVLACMRKVPSDVTANFIRSYRETNARIGKNQFLVPYFMSGHPGCGLKESVELAEFINAIGVRPEQVQEFTPTPGSLSSCMYHTGLDPMTGKPVYVPRDPDERAMQRALLQFWMPKNRDLVRRALEKTGRTDLIGRSKKCLIPGP